MASWSSSSTKPAERSSAPAAGSSGRKEPFERERESQRRVSEEAPGGSSARKRAKVTVPARRGIGAGEDGREQGRRQASPRIRLGACEQATTHAAPCRRRPSALATRLALLAGLLSLGSSVSEMFASFRTSSSAP